ncbi:very-long-chain 3-oxoacyl-CoA reductase [Thalassophryne amazonica]|uniref:very-long-chain 3-oxoacyl-CoA reductase n=1 Tax=Thalassophryne amazonica TaxID=390379 RepID=UPI0014720933|nr:very-long-chain 3-oxoacyl-CoA reductase [Thalassophryne amazonica]
MSFTGALAIIGGFMVIFHSVKLTWRCWCGFRTFVLSHAWQVDLKTYGKWAVVTGATSGIGKAYATELAQRGLDVVLISRSVDKLQMVAKEIEDQCGRNTRTIQVDFTDGQSIYSVIAKQLQGLEIGILVNNVGMTYSENFAYFLEIPDTKREEQKITQVINCNMLSVPQMTTLVLPGMVARGKGLIINIASEVGIRPQPLLSLYSATKIFVIFFSKCLHAEYKSKGITVQCVAPLMVSTNMTKNVKVNCFIKTATSFVCEALKTVGHSSYTSGCLSHALQNAALRILLPDWLRMSSFLIRKLHNFATIRSCEKELYSGKQKSIEKE